MWSRSPAACDPRERRLSSSRRHPDARRTLAEAVRPRERGAPAPHQPAGRRKWRRSGPSPPITSWISWQRPARAGGRCCLSAPPDTAIPPTARCRRLRAARPWSAPIGCRTTACCRPATATSRATCSCRRRSPRSAHGGGHADHDAFAAGAAGWLDDFALYRRHQARPRRRAVDAVAGRAPRSRRRARWPRRAPSWPTASRSRASCSGASTATGACCAATRTNAASG